MLELPTEDAGPGREEGCWARGSKSRYWASGATGYISQPRGRAGNAAPPWGRALAATSALLRPLRGLPTPPPGSRRPERPFFTNARSPGRCAAKWSSSRSQTRPPPSFHSSCPQRRVSGELQRPPPSSSLPAGPSTDDGPCPSTAETRWRPLSWKPKQNLAPIRGATAS